MNYETLLLTIEDSVATVTLHRPAKLNALTMTMFHELYDVFGALETDKAARAIVLTGAGRVFCAGGDINDILVDLPSLSGADRERNVLFSNQVVQRIYRTAKPVIAAVHGLALGGGACLVLPCDIRIAADDAKLGFIMTSRGVSAADMGATWLLQRIVGTGRASELLLGGDVIDASFAERIGLVNHVVSAGELLPYAQQMARKFASRAPIALRETKRALARGATNDLASDIEVEALVQSFCLRTKEAEEGVKSYLEHREPCYEVE